MPQDPADDGQVTSPRDRQALPGEKPGDLKAPRDELLRASLALAGVTCGSLRKPEPPLVVAVFDPTRNTVQDIARGAEARVIKAPSRSADEPALIAFAVMENSRMDVARRLEWPPGVARKGQRDPARLVGRAVARANGMTFLSVSPGDYGGHLVRLRHSLSGPMPLPPVILLSILVEGDKPIVLPPAPQPPRTRPPPADAAVADWFGERGPRVFAETGRKPFRDRMLAECRIQTGATYPQMERVWPGSMPAHLRRKRGERG